MINLELEDAEINALYQVFHRALQNAGMDALDAIAHFRGKILTAQREQNGPPMRPAKPNGNAARPEPNG